MTERTNTGTGGVPAQDELLEGALHNFRQSVHAWSDAEFSRPRAVVAAHRGVRHPWALVSCTLGAVLAAGLAVAGVHERDLRVQQEHIAAARQAEQQREMAAERARESEDLLANVDKDVSREVPSALEPLARLMDESSQ